MKTARIARLAAALALIVNAAAIAQSEEAMTSHPGTSAIPAGATDVNDDKGPDAAKAGSQLRYLFIAGSSFAPRDSAQPAAYAGAGCIRASSGNSSLYAADVQLPANSEVAYVRTYFYNDGVGSTIRTFFTKFDGAGNYVEHTSFPTPTNGTGYSSTLSPPISVTIDPLNHSYIMLVNMGAANSNLRFCGVRIQYY